MTITSKNNFLANPEVDAIRHHYEVGNSFYALFLGKTMMYSGGYWKPGEGLREGLDRAQERKLDRFAELAQVGDGDRILDVGCGWGTLMNRVTDRYGAGEAVGLTLSRTQVSYIEALGNPRIKSRVESWEDHETSRPYDSAFCVNALEHFVHSSLSPRERTHRYRVFFQKIHDLLRPGGKFVLYTMTAEALPMTRELLEDLKFLQRSEFEGCHIPHLYELSAGAEGLFSVDEIVNERETFAMACRAWLDRIAENRTEAVALEGESVVARFERYLNIFAYTLEDGFFNNFRITLERRI